MNRLNRIKLRGFKSIKDATLELKSLNVLIGANGAGKSNFISFLKLLNQMANGHLQLSIGREGGGNALLYYGSKVTKELECKLDFKTEEGFWAYHMKLVTAIHDQLVFADEYVAFQDFKYLDVLGWSLGAGHKETIMREGEWETSTEKKVVGKIRNLINHWRFYQFHDTSREANIKTNSYISDNRFLRDDGGNLASYLYMLKNHKPKHYKRIVATIRQVAPFFDDFYLEPMVENKNMIALEWKEKKSDLIFNVNQLSDGTIRMMALITSLLQPDLPPLICIDEPEIGLHPYAIHVLASLLKTASQQTQIIVSTQSVSLVDHFEPEDLVIVNRKDGETIFERLSKEQLADWLDDYSIGELWEKNVLGGRPSQ